MIRLVTKRVLSRDRIYCNNSNEIVNFFRERYRPEAWTAERMYCLALTSASEVIGVMEVSRGDVVSTIASPYIVFQFVLLCNTPSVILLHNHPSGRCNPSKNDLVSAETMQRAGDLFNVMVLDNIILGDTNYWSSSQGGILMYEEETV